MESSRKALDTARESVGLNPDLRADVFEWVQEDVFAYLESPPPCDVVVAGPAAVRAKTLRAAGGAERLPQPVPAVHPHPGARRHRVPLFLLRCRGSTDVPAGRRWRPRSIRAASVRLLRELHADVDHPVSANHPEGEYLKGWMVHAE